MFPLLSCRRVLLECIIVSYSWSSIHVCFLAHSIGLFKSSSKMDGLKSIMSNNVRKRSMFLCLSCENQFTTSLVFFHWFNLQFDPISVLIMSKIYFLTLPISVFVGLISRHFMLFSKFSLWSLRVMKAGFLLSALIYFRYAVFLPLICIRLQCQLRFGVSLFCTVELYFHSKVYHNLHSSFHTYCLFCLLQQLFR